jgi:Arc/MetJ family transcription regulator
VYPLVYANEHRDRRPVLHEAQELIGAGTKRETVDVALRELVARHRRIGVLDLRGGVRWAGDLDDSRRGRS